MRAIVTWSLGMVISWTASTSAAQSAPAASSPAPDLHRTPPPYYELYPDHLPYRNGDPVPLGYLVEKNTTRGWGIVGGSIALGVFYTYGILAVRQSSSGAAWMFLPVVGPPGLFITNSRHCNPRCAGMEQSAVVVDAVGQAAGAALLIWGLASWRLRLVRQDLVHPEAFVGPMPVGSGYGVGALGSF
jgi:hypothetical protein